MKATILISILFVTSHFSNVKNETLQTEIPDDLFGSWKIEQIGEGEIPSQIFRRVYKKTNKNEGVTEFQWLFKRAEDRDYLAVGVSVGNFTIQGDIVTVINTKFGSQQAEPMSDVFYDTIKWYYPGDLNYEKSPKKEVYSVELKGNILIVKTDNNGDGDYDDEYEVDEYMKEE